MATAKSTRKPSTTATTASSVATRASAPVVRRSTPQGVEMEKLDSWFEGVSQPSRRIQDLVKRKRARHDGLVRQLRQELFRERSAAESTVCFISTNLRTELDKASLMVKLKGQEVAEVAEEQQQQHQTGALTEAVAAAGDVVQQLTEQRRRAVDAFYDLLLDVEAEHQKRAKAALKRFGEALAANGHLPPHRLHPVLDSERKEVSELHLRHVISFGDLRLCLNMHAERDCRRFREAVENTRRLCGERRQREALTAIQEAGNKALDEYIMSTSMGRSSVEDLESKLNELKVAVNWSEYYPFFADGVKSWATYVQSHFHHIDSGAKKICKCLSEGLTQLKTFCLNEIESLKDFLISGDLTTSENFKKLHRNVCLPLMTSIDKKLSEDPASFTVDMEQLLIKLTVRFDTFANLLREAGELWDKFSALQRLCRQKTLQKLHDTIPQRKKCVEAKEQRIAKIINKSKEETNKHHLQENVSRIFRILDEVKSSLENMHNRERNMIEEHASMFVADLDLFDPNIKLFLEKHERLQVKSGSSVCIGNFSRNFDLIEATVQVIEEEEARCYEDINRYLSGQFKSNMQIEEKRWVHEETKKLEIEFSVILESHQRRYGAIQSEVETTRLTQLDNNEKSFEIQREAILKVSNLLQEILNEAFVKELLIFTNFSSQIKTLKERGLNDKLMDSVKSTIQEVETCYKLCKETIKNLNNDFQTTAEEQIDNLKKNNLQYLATLRHFSDGGTFSELEMSKLKSEVGKLEQHVEAVAKKNVLSLKQRSKECCSEAMKHVTLCRRDLQLHLEDLNFTNNVTALVQRTQSQLKKHTLALKYGGKLLVEQVADLEDEEGNSVSDIRKKWRCVIQTVSRRLDWLLPRELENTVVDKMDTTYKSTLMIYNEGGDFLSLVFNTLAESLQEIEQIVVNFNNKKTAFTVPPSGLHEEVQSFMTDIASKYRLYQEQCLDVWINELTVFLGTISKLRKEHDNISNNSFSTMSKFLSQLLDDEQSNLNKKLMNFRKEYQQHQVDVMAQFRPAQRFSESQYIFSSLCAEFEKTSGLLSQNIKNLIEAYMEKANQYLHSYEIDMKEQISLILETTEQLFRREIGEDILKRIEKELEHLNELFACTNPIDTNVFPQLSCERNFKKRNQPTCPPELLISIQSLLTAAENFRNQCKQDLNNPTYHTPNSLTEVLEKKMEDAKILVHNRTCEIRHLYDQYKNMAEELRMKWRYTLDNIQQH